ncbi:MAG: hypothetical protein ACQEV6_08250 [Pseudomonadota bacterium]
MTLTLGTTPHSNWQTLIPILEALGCAASDQNSPEHWYLAEDVEPEGPLLLAYTRPEHALATAMEEGLAPSVALQQWTEHAQALVTLFKANRHQAVMIDITRAQQHPEQAATTLASHWQLEVAPPVNTLNNTTGPANPYYQLVATFAVQQDKSIQPLLAQLEACTLPLTEDEPECESIQDPDTLYTGLRATWQELENGKQLKKNEQQIQADCERAWMARAQTQQQLHQAQSQLNELQEENTKLQQINGDLQKTHSEFQQSNAEEESQLLLEQLHLVQEELERHVLAGKDTEKTLATLKIKLEQAEKQAKETDKQRAQAEQAKTKAEQELKAIKAEQKTLQKQYQTLENERKTLQETLKKDQATLKKEQTAHTKTKAEKATQENQLQALKTANKDQTSQLENLTEENQLVLEQLHLVQEELENKFLQAKDQEQTLAMVQTKLEQTENQLQQRTDQQAASQKEAELLQRRLHKLRETMESLEHSNRALNGNLAELKNQLAAAKKHRADWEHKYLQAERNGTLALASANRRITELSSELNKVTNSRSWKLTNPATAYSKKAKKAAEEKLEQQTAEIKNSGLFDETWYLEQYQDVAEAGLNPIEHYLKAGAYEGRNPSETFDTAWYLSYYSDVTESGLNPLVHYIRFGLEEERAPRPGALVSLPAPEAKNTGEQQ